jgi:hypothetical protein
LKTMLCIPKIEPNARSVKSVFACKATGNYGYPEDAPYCDLPLPAFRGFSKDLWNTLTLKIGFSRVPLIRIGNTVPAPFFSKNGSNAFRKSDLEPVTVCESLA